MMIREWRCNTCEMTFEATEPVCPVCHQENVTRVFLTPPAVHTSGRAKFVDKQMAALAADYGFTDLSNVHTGSVAGDAKRRKAHVVGGEIAPSGIQNLIDQKMDQMVGRYAPNPATPAPTEPTKLIQKPLGNDAATVVSAPKLRPSPGSLRHPDDL